MFEDYLDLIYGRDWKLTHLIWLGDCSWQANISNDEYVIVATGESPTHALAEALDRIADEANYKPKLGFKLDFAAPRISLTALFGKAPEAIRRKL